MKIKDPKVQEFTQAFSELLKVEEEEWSEAENHQHILSDGTIITHSHSHTHTQTAAVLNRMARLIGHLNATKKMVENAATVPLTHEYTYDNFGNTLTHKVSGSGITAVTTTFTYDATHRFVATEKSSANSVIASYSYNNLGRLTKKQEGISGSLLTTAYTYDAIGNITQITYPDNTKTTYTRGWGDRYPDRAYYITATTTAQAPITTWYDNIGREKEVLTKGEKNINLATYTYYDEKTGKISSVRNVAGNIALTDVYTYNSLGQLTKIAYGNGQSESYTHSNRSVKTSFNGRSIEQTFDAWGNLNYVQDNGVSGCVYTYASSGNPSKIHYSDYNSSTADITMDYNSRGLQTTLTDVDAGKTTYEYDALGRVTKQTDARGNVTTNTYNASGLLTQQVCGGVTTEYDYYDDLRLKQEKTGNQIIDYEYVGDLNRIKKKTYTIDGVKLEFSYVYNSNGQVTQKTYPDNMVETYTYDASGSLATIHFNHQLMWDLTTSTGMQRTYQTANNLTIGKTYTNKGHLSMIEAKKGAAVLHSLGYTYNTATGNLTQRTGMNGTENFTYDNFDRLTTGTSYALNGNIGNKTGIGKYTYDATKKHAVVQVENSGNLIPKENVEVTYNAFNKVETVTKGNLKLGITYGPDRQRTRTVLLNDNHLGKCTLYAENYEQLITANGSSVTHYYYIYSPDGLVAVYVKNNGAAAGTAYYIETDHLGSIVRAYDYVGNTKFSASYDAWGNQTVSTNAISLSRGYTGHEHWNQFGLIDMNGRFYDPLLGRFLSPDPYVQMPENPQNFNRYSYCLNNPLKYTDPSGEYFGIDDLVAGVIGGTINLVANAIQGNLSGHGVWGGIGRGFAAFGAGAVGGVGALYPEFGGWAWGGAAVGATNAWLGGASSASDIAMGACVGAVAGIAGGAAGQWATTATSPLVSSISSPVARSAVSGIIGGAAGGYAGGFTGGLIMTGDLKSANKAGLSGLYTGASIGGVVGGFAGYRYAKANDLNPWTGRVNPWEPLAPIECNGGKYFNSAYSDSKELIIPSKLSHYSQSDPQYWNSIGFIQDDPIYLTTNSELSGIGAKVELALRNTPNFRMDINGATLDPTKIMLIRRVNGNVYGQGGGGWEVIYKGPLNLNKNNVINITKLP